MRRGEHLRPLPQLLSHCEVVCPGRLIRLPAPLLSASFPLWVRVPARTIDKSYAPRDYKPVITDGCVMTTVRDGIAGAFAWEK